jgi:hypothetical protein
MIDEKVRERLLTLGRELVFLLEERLPQDYDWEIEVEDTLEKLMDWKPSGPPVRKAVAVADGMVLANDGTLWKWGLDTGWGRLMDLPQD